MLARLRGEALGYLMLAVVLTSMMAVLGGQFAVEWLSVRFVISLLICFSIGSTIHLLQTLVLSRLGMERRSRTTAALLKSAVLVVSIVMGVEVSLWIARTVFPETARYFPRRGVLPVAVPVTLAMTAIFLSIGRLKKRTEELELREAQVERELLRSQLEALQARTNPHFLFNSLNTVAALIGEDPVRAERAVEQLSGLFRYTLDGERRGRVALSEEIDAVKAYLEFERLRFGERFVASVELDPDAASTLVPPFILQPLVENAIHHGVASRRGVAQVLVVAKKIGAVVELTVEDDGPGPGGSTHEGARTSHVDLERRLKLAYEGRAEMKTGRGPLGGYRVELHLPCEEGTDADPGRR